MDWKQSFETAALEKGWQLYQQNKISDISKNGDVYFGLVQDEEDTDLIQAQIENGQIITIECSCPDSAKGELCAHEAAFLFKLEDYSDLSEIEDISAENPAKPADDKEIIEQEIQEENAAQDSENFAEENIKTEDANNENININIENESHIPKENLLEDTTINMDNPIKEENNLDNELDESLETDFADTGQSEPAETVPSIKKLKNRFEKFIDKIPEEELQEFVYQYALSHERFKQKLILEFSEEFPEEIMDALLQELDEIIVKAKGKTGVINEYNNDFAEEYKRFVKDTVLSMIKNNYLQEAFSFITYSLNNLQDEDIYDEVSDSIYNSALKWIEILLEKSDEYLTGEIFTWLENQLDKKEILFDRNLENLWLSHFQFKPYISSLENYVDKKIEDRLSESGKRRYFGYGLDRYLLYKYQILKKDPQKANEIAGFLEKYASYPEFYLKIAKDMFEKEEYEGLKKWLSDYKIREDLSEYDKLSASHLLRNVYKLEENKISYLDELSYALKNLGESSLDAIMEYKKLVPSNQWDSMYDHLQQSLNDYSKADLYAQLKDLDLLMNLMENNPDSKYLVEDYSDLVKNTYPQRTAKLYLELAKHTVEEGKGRKEYAQALHYLQTAKEIYPLNKDIQDLIAYWKNQYRRKSSLMHEIAASGLDQK